MSTITATVPAVTEKSGLVSRTVSAVRNRIAGVLASLSVLFVVIPQTAHAAPPPTDLTGGAGDTFFSSITDYFTGNVLAAVLLLFALFVGVGILMRWGKKAASAA